MNLNNPKYYVNREISWLLFNGRVLEEAQDKTNLIMERLKFLAITASNMDEFFMVRVASLLELVLVEFDKKDASGYTPEAQLKEICKITHEIVTRQYNCLNRSLLPTLEKENIHFLEFKDVNHEQEEFLRRYFLSTVFPILTPMAIDQSRPFPLLNSKSLNLIIELHGENEEEIKSEETKFAVMQVPNVIPRILALPSSKKETSKETPKKEFIFLENVIKEYIDELFIGNKVITTAAFRITRDSDIEIDEEETEDLLNKIEKSIRRRKWGEPVRLEIEKSMHKSPRHFLEKTLELSKNYIYEISGPIDLTVWMGFSGLKGYDYLRNKNLVPQPCVDFMYKDIFEAIKEKDILVHHPYESFESVLNFVTKASVDPQVLAIKQTLYRVSGNSPIVNALIQAAENGKQVTVLVELKARFDEENNIIWAKKLEKSGCHVVYGLVGLKTHCKICLVVRKEDDGIKRYIHLSTGNYNDTTAKIYTDFGFFTCKETFGNDVSALFNVLTGYSAYSSWSKISVAPLTLRETFIRYIRNEAKNAGEGKESLIIAQLNSLVDTAIIQELYLASMAGVKIKLIVRGICCLKAGIEGVSDNIAVTSIVDRFLEHSRIYYFENGGMSKIFLSSADWMPRNLDRRVEVAFPIEDQELKERILEVLTITLSDTKKLRIQQKDGTYEKIDKRGKELIHSQLLFHEMAVDRVNQAIREENKEIFTPVLAADNRSI